MVTANLLFQKSSTPLNNPLRREGADSGSINGMARRFLLRRTGHGFQRFTRIILIDYLMPSIQVTLFPSQVSGAVKAGIKNIFISIVDVFVKLNPFLLL